MLKKVCLCGKPNVGKSTLFNRLIGKKRAIVLDKPGVTRDVYRTATQWNGFELELADLAGLEFIEARQKRGFKELTQTKKNEIQLKELATEAATDYLKTADLVLFVVDGRQTPTTADEELSRLIQKMKKEKVMLVLAKVEGNVEDLAQAEYSILGWGEGIATSAEHNMGIETLKESILIELFGKPFKETEEEEEEIDEQAAAEQEKLLKETIAGDSAQKPICLGVYGRPNVGKSSLVNALLGQKRMITSPIAGTTVDTVDSDFKHGEKFYRILDTAGIRRKAKTEQGVEVLSVVQAIKSIANVHMALFLIDGYEGVTDQDEKIAGEIYKSGKPVLIVINKWDLCRVEKEAYADRVRESLGFLDFAPILFISATNQEGLEPLFDLIGEVLKQRMFVAPTGELNRFLEVVEGTNNPGDARLYYASQTSKNPPTITCLVNDPKKIHFAYERFLKNELRNRYGWVGSPIELIFKARSRSASKKDAHPNRAAPKKYFKKKN